MTPILSPSFLRSFAAAALLVCGLGSAIAQAQGPTAVPRPPPPTVQVPPAIDAVLRAYERAWTAQDATALAGLFTDDGMALPNGSPPAVGANAIAQEYAGNAGGPLFLRPFAFQQSGDTAYVAGGFAPAAGQPDAGKFVLLLRRAADGQWRLLADIDNMNQRPRPRPPGAGAAASRPMP